GDPPPQSQSPVNGGYGSTGENTYVPPGSNTTDPNDLTIPINTDPTVVGSTPPPDTTNATNPFAGFGTAPVSNGPVDNSDEIFGPSGSGGIFGGGLGQGSVIPLPISPGAALAATILLSGGNIFGGGSGSLAGTISQAGNVVTDPIGATGTALSNLNQNIM